MAVLLLGANHDTATVAVRECLTIPPDRIAEALRFINQSTGEVALISTCNRTEFYATDPRTSERVLRDFIYNHSGLSSGELDRALYRLEGEEAIRHLMRVASGLDSMIVGEPQILGQVREAWQVARQAGSLGPVLDALFRAAINSGKFARSQTSISRGAVSISHAAVEIARQHHGDLAGKSVLVIGAGETGTLVARNLRSHGAGELLVVNRTFARANELAKAFGGRAFAFERLPEALRQADIVISCTGSPEPIVTREVLESATAGRSVLAIDIAVPRDIASDVTEIPGVKLCDLDALQQLVTGNNIARQQAAGQVERTIDDHVTLFQSWYAGHCGGDTIRALQDYADRIRQAQVERLLRRTPDLDPRQQQMIHIFSEQLVNALLHTPITELRDPVHGPANAAALRALFDLDLELLAENTPVDLDHSVA